MSTSSTGKSKKRKDQQLERMACRGKKRKDQQLERMACRGNPHSSHQEEENKYDENSNDLKLINVPYLPKSIITEILSRLGIKTLFKFRLACKRWDTLITSPEFMQIHHSRSPTLCLILSTEKFPSADKLALMDPESLDILNDTLVLTLNDDIRDVIIPLLTNSCYGLVCFWCFPGRSIIVCNPVFREYIVLPQHPSVAKHEMVSCAIGFSRITNQYKVVVSTSYNNSSGSVSDKFKAYIYTLGGGSWRSIENAPYNIITDYSSSFLNGALHWIHSDHQYPFICCFNFETESFGAIPEPPHFGPLKFPERVFRVTIGEIKGNLTLCDFNPTSIERIVIWVMNKYGVRDSWTKDFVITYPVNNLLPHLITVNRNGEILIFFINEFVLYDPKSNDLISKIKFCGVNAITPVIGYVPCMVSLKNAAIGHSIKRM